MNIPAQAPIKKTKILATLGPSIDTPDKLAALVESGVDVFRLNFSHGDHTDHAERLGWIRELEQTLGRPIGVLMDLQGPKLRVGTFAGGSVRLDAGQPFRLDLDDRPGDSTRVRLPHPAIFEAMRPGMELLLDDGKIRLRIEKAGTDTLQTRVITGGELSDRKGVNVPDAVLDVSPLTDKDLADLAFGLELGVDWVALSFVQTAADVEQARRLIDGRAFLLSKIEKPSALTNLEAIVECSDAIMIARGDLGVELPAERLPGSQKRIIETCRRQGKPVVVATQMLESMRFSPAPTRAEVTDVANAVYEGADAVMLSAETASGDYPVEAVQMMSKVIRQVEADPAYAGLLEATLPPPEASVSGALCCAVRRIARIIPVSVLINYTNSGSTSLRAARERPQAPILSLTPHLATARRLTLAWGVVSLHGRQFEQVSELVETALLCARHTGMAKPGSTVVITAGCPFGRTGSTNLLQIETVTAH